MYAVTQKCEMGSMFYFQATDIGWPADLIFAYYEGDGRWWLGDDDSSEDEPGFDWARDVFPVVLQLAGPPAGPEVGYQGDLVRLDGDTYRLQDSFHCWVVFEGSARVYGLPPEPEPEPEPAPIPEALDGMHIIQLPSGKKRNMLHYHGEDPQPDGTLRVIWASMRVILHPNGGVSFVGESHESLAGADAAYFAEYTAAMVKKRAGGLRGAVAGLLRRLGV